MLHTETVSAATLGTLKQLMAIPEIETEGIRLLSMIDIIPMKLGAVSGRGAKKDFFDIAALLDIYTIDEMIDFYKRKYASDDIGFIVRSLCYFEDAELQNDPVTLNGSTWPGVKNKIESALKKYVANRQ